MNASFLRVFAVENEQQINAFYHITTQKKSAQLLQSYETEL